MMEKPPMSDLRELQPAVRTLAMPGDANPAGDIFGGWILAQMDIAAGVAAYIRAKGRVATIAIDAMTFHQPVFVGDIVSCYAQVTRIGRTSITVHVEAWVQRRNESRNILVTDGNFTYVAIDDNGHPQPIRRDGSSITA